MSSHDEEFTQFAAAASPRLLKAAWFICGDAVAAQDLVQNALTKVYLRWGRLRDEQPYAYARRCLLTEHVDGWRKWFRERPAARLPERAVVAPDPDLRSTLVQALATLPLRERQIVVMRHYADMSEADVAAALGVSVGTVKSAASRGLAKLRTTLSQEGESYVR